VHTVNAGTVVGTSCLIDEYLAHLEDVGREPTTINHYREILTRMDAELPAGLTRACADELKEWINQPGRGGRRRANKTRRHYQTIATGFFDWGFDFNPARALPEIKVARGTRVRPIDTQTLHAILAAAGEPYRRWFLLAAYAGLRCIELSRLERADVTATEILVHGKGSVERVIPTHPLIWEDVADARGRLCRRLDGGPTSRHYISAEGGNYLKATLGLDGVHMHRLRKWFGTAAYAASGNNIRVVQKLLGHADVGTTQIYIDTDAQGMTGAVAGLPVS
jgi:integrase/recombinase XerC